jgi:hypothetical protein
MCDLYLVGSVVIQMCDLYPTASVIVQMGKVAMDTYFSNLVFVSFFKAF